ncbi:MAG: hypothetical protein KatS3mg009_3047 [Acidimicrobiia bacterium]|nr:MAG: hypothetical protein KatS3mg009_3047 [Acidimicrobiia bacterium]
MRDDLGADVDVVLDGGPCTVGVESTIVDLTGAEPRVLREGAVDVARLAAVLGEAPRSAARRPRRARSRRTTRPTPGSRSWRSGARAARRAAAHVRAGRRVGVLALAAELAGGATLPPGAVALDAGSDPGEYARVLYARLREADRMGLDVVVAVPPPAHGVGAAVGDRLRRAAGG